MATGVPFPEANVVLVGPTPEDRQAGTVYDLHVMRYRDFDGVPNLLTCWELSDAEVETIIRTRRIWHNAWGTTVSPMFLTGHTPFGEGGWLKQR